MTSVTFNELPKKALNLIFKNLEQTELQKLRVVCSTWRNFINETFPVELVITQGNFERLFRCPTAASVEIKNLTTEYLGDVGFGHCVQSMQFTGKVLSSNVITILRCCPELVSLKFSSLKQVLGIEGVESIKLPKVTTLEIVVRPDQETFTSDEIIVISVMKQINFSALETLLINTGDTLENWDEGRNNSNSTCYGGETRSFTISELSDVASVPFANPQVTTNVSASAVSEVAEQQPPEPNPVVETDLPFGNSTIDQDLVENSPVTLTEGTQTQAPNNFQVLINRATEFDNGFLSVRDGISTASDAGTSPSNTSSAASRRARYNLSDFEARIFYASLELQMENRERSTWDILNDSRSRTTGAESATFFDVSGLSATPTVNHTGCFELVRNNHLTLKNLYVRTRPDFMCFGNLSSFAREVPKIQFEEIEYSFGRTQICYEHTLLQSQTKLTKLRINVVDDMWQHAMAAIDNSHETLTDLDARIMNVHEEHVDITAITKCAKLKHLKLLHFCEKESLYRLPMSLNKLTINGPISYKDMNSWTQILKELQELTLLLNVQGDKIDLPLYKKFLKMPMISRMSFIQCPMNLGAIRQYIDSMNFPKGGFKFWINGPREIGEVPMIQYVYTVILPDKFNRDVIDIEEPLH
ncbi:unnamed protein product [Orchesella dallaii]|uniref:F-box domain-containing protein n=1 Tax=Orchesella dallaii TaxID=48710 RepID=A0ABP1RTE8_9HEXA